MTTSSNDSTMSSDPTTPADPTMSSDPTSLTDPAVNREMTRRQVLVGLGTTAAVAATGLAMPVRNGGGAYVSMEAAGAAVSEQAPLGQVAPTPAATKKAPGILVLVTLYGGNDGLDTLIPYANSAYLAGRGALAVGADRVLTLDPEFGLHPSMVGFKKLWDDQKLAIVRGVGYPNPNRSHFRSMDIWQSGVPDRAEVSGWLGRWQDATSTDPLRMLSLGPSVPRALIGLKGGGGSALPNGQVVLPGGAGITNAFVELGRGLAGSELGPWGAKVGSSVTNLVRVIDQLGPILKNGTQSAETASLEGGSAANGDSNSVLDSQLTDVATLIKGDAPTRVYSVALGGFDTHAREQDQHARLLGTVDGAISRFLASLANQPRAAGVTVVVYSEFGRRVSANLSDGTDHGTAAPVFVVGPGVRGGFYGEPPSLTDLDQGDLKYTTDFRSVYASILADVLGVDPSVTLSGSWPRLPFLR